MRSIAACALLAFGLAACGESVSGPEPQSRNTKPQEPMQSLASSAQDCPTRCFVPINTGLSGGLPYLIRGNEEAAVIGQVTQDGGFTWTSEAGTRVLPPRGASEPLGLNEWGQIVGRVGSTAVAWEPDGTLIELSQGPGGALLNGRAIAINDNSVIVGESDGRAFRTHYSEGFRWLTEPGTKSAAVDITQDGQIVGWYEPSPGVKRPFLWTTSGGLRDLGVLPGQDGAEAVAISETGIVVGFGWGSTGRRGFIWTASGGMKPLVEDFRPWDVNHWGEIAGTNMDGTRCFVWYEGYGMLQLPDNGHKTCYVKSINSWGDVAGGTYDSYNTSFEKVPGSPGVWTWAENRWRYQK